MLVFSQVLQALLRYTGTLTSQDKVSREREMKWNRVNEEWFTIAKSIVESDSVDNDLITIPRTYGRQ